jgi:hypothetical protein
VTSTKKRLDREELDVLTLATPEARVAYEELKSERCKERERLKMREKGTSSFPHPETELSTPDLRHTAGSSVLALRRVAGETGCAVEPLSGRVLESGNVR